KAAVCANVGMLRFEKMINRPKVPSPQEKQALKTHTLLGYKIVAKKMKMEQSIAACTLNHHEAIDGSGYPRKLKGDQISLMTKVVSICLDYVETMRGAPFTQKQLPYAALRKICGGAKKKYHSALINYLVRELSMYPLGSVVQLKDMSMGVVIDANPRVPLRPTVKVVINADGEVLKENKIINMAEATSVFIHEVIDDNELIERVFENL
ncbi:MAG TPA: HD domain-containing phosphohydrolase, partial [Spirochaetota bacterium]|nr:HD domain-containing phosphohydrolase [Spirochaetota bacterium]